MKRLRGYLWWSVMMPALAMLGVLVALDSLFSMVHELEFLRGDYQVLQALQYVFTSIPHRAAEFLPMAVLLGTLLGLGFLANSGELTVIRAAGVSQYRIGWLVLRPALFLLLLGLLNGEYLAPYAQQVAHSNRSLAESSGEAIRSKFGYWHRDGSEFIHINAVQPNGVLYGVPRYRFKGEQALEELVYVERAIYQGDAWFLEGIRGTRLQDDRAESYAESTAVWETNLTPELLSYVILEPEHLSFSKLYQYGAYLGSQGLDGAEYKLAFWQKLMVPVASIGMVLIAISFVFGPLREVTMGLRLTAGIVASLVFHYGQQFFGHLSIVFDASPFLAATVPALLCVFAGLLLMRRAA
jgi:lipopolysaccharide export system permease protein